MARTHNGGGVELEYLPNAENGTRKKTPENKFIKLMSENVFDAFEDGSGEGRGGGESLPTS